MQNKTKYNSLSSHQADRQPKTAIHTLFLLTLLECDVGATFSHEPLAAALAEVVPDESWWLENKGAKAGRWVRSALTSASSAPEKSCTSYLLNIEIRLLPFLLLQTPTQTSE